MLPIIVLAGGYGTRLGGITATRPKSLVMIQERPFIEYQLDLLYHSGFKDIYFCLGHMQEQIIEVLKNYPIKFTLDNQDVGTGKAIEIISKEFNLNNFFVTYGDSYLEIDYKDVQNKYFQEDKKSLMVIYKNENKNDFSNIEYNGKIINYNKEHPNKKMNYIDYGISIFNGECFNVSKKSYDLSFIHKKLIKDGDISDYVAKNRFYEIGSLSGINDFTNFIRSKNGLSGRIYQRNNFYSKELG